MNNLFCDGKFAQIHYYHKILLHPYNSNCKSFDQMIYYAINNNYKKIFEIKNNDKYLITNLDQKITKFIEIYDLPFNFNEIKEIFTKIRDIEISKIIFDKTLYLLNTSLFYHKDLYYSILTSIKNGIDKSKLLHLVNINPHYSTFWINQMQQYPMKLYSIHPQSLNSCDKFAKICNQLLLNQPFDIYQFHWNKKIIKSIELYRPSNSTKCAKLIY